VRREGPIDQVMPFSSSDMTSDLARLIVSARHELLAEIVNSLMQGKQFVALTGPPGVGKTAMAAAIHEELVRHAVRVQRVHSGAGDSIRLSTIIAQLLGKPESDVGADDIEWLFGAMTERELPDGRWAVIIDDAELLHSDVFRYLRLLSIVAMGRMPQMIFVGDPSFWDTADQPARGGVQDLITARWELGPMSRDETRAVAEQLLSAPSRANRLIYDEGALATVVQRSDGLIGRAIALLSEGAAIANARHQSEVTAAVIDAAAGRIDRWAVAKPGKANHGPQPQPQPQPQPWPTATEHASERSYGPPGPEAAVVSIETQPASIVAVVRRPRRVRKITLLVGAAAVFGAIGAAAYWWEPVGADQIWVRARTALGHWKPVEGPSADAAIIVRLAPSMLVIWPGASISNDAIEEPVTASSSAPEIIVPREPASPETEDGAPALATPQPSANVGVLGASQVPRIVARTPGQNARWAAAAHRGGTPPVYGPFGDADGRAPSVDVRRSGQGTWLFAPNSNGN
jgi:type II secretory pathway predicted ATPase ExeA